MAGAALCLALRRERSEAMAAWGTGTESSGQDWPAEGSTVIGEDPSTLTDGSSPIMKAVDAPGLPVVVADPLFRPSRAARPGHDPFRCRLLLAGSTLSLRISGRVVAANFRAGSTRSRRWPPPRSTLSAQVDSLGADDQSHPQSDNENRAAWMNRRTVHFGGADRAGKLAQGRSTVRAHQFEDDPSQLSREHGGTARPSRSHLTNPDHPGSADELVMDCMITPDSVMDCMARGRGGRGQDRSPMPLARVGPGRVS